MPKEGDIGAESSIGPRGGRKLLRENMEHCKSTDVLFSLKCIPGPIRVGYAGSRGCKGAGKSGGGKRDKASLFGD